MRNTTLAVAALAALYAIACSTDTTSPSVASVSLAADSVIAVGATTQIVAVDKDASGSIVGDLDVAYVSSDTTIATVSATGVVTGVAPGVAMITGTVEGQSASVTVHVIAAPPASTSRQRPVAAAKFHFNTSRIAHLYMLELRSTQRAASQFG
jgi:hypothetical protein